MENGSRQMNSFSGPVPLGEEGVPPELMSVRTLLQGLPKLCCPASFEYSFQRRLRSTVSGRREGRTTRGWMLGWTGAGLGFAAAFAVAVFVFRVGVGTTPDAGMIAGGATDASGTSVVSAPTQMAGEAMPSGSEAVPQQLASEDKSPASAARDSHAVTDPTPLPRDLYHMVSGSE